MKPTEFLRETIDLVKSIETRYLELAARLYRIREEKIYASTYDTFFEFLEAAKINQGQASKLMSIHRVFIEEGKQTKEKLAQIGYSNLYTAIPLVGSQGLEVAVAKAETLSRSELSDEVREHKHGVHNHEPKDNRRFAICACGKFIEVHENN